MSSNRGKNFTAAEKHFIRKQEAYQKQIRELNAVVQRLASEKSQLTGRIALIQEQNKELQEQNETLMKLNGISKEELEKLMKHAEDTAIVRSFFLGITKGAGYL